METPQPPSPPAAARDAAARRQWVLESLEEDQLVAAKTRRLGRARLGRGAQVLMWALRVYVLVMVAIVIYTIFHAR
ncbi:MAG TPA: hypothetical protein VE996_08500 [Terriglobales bacterium]|nr:hypothetical protein [Terriglobales bacterium]